MQKEYAALQTVEQRQAADEEHKSVIVAKMAEVSKEHSRLKVMRGILKSEWTELSGTMSG